MKVIRLEGGIEHGKEVEVECFPRYYLVDGDAYEPSYMTSKQFAVYRPVEDADRDQRQSASMGILPPDARLK